jgi:hypothetical protein
MGVAHVPDGRGTFTGLSVEENLRLGAYVRGNKTELLQDMERMFERFPILKNAPREGEYTNNIDVQHKPFALHLRKVQCKRCLQWGHSLGDRECPLRDTTDPKDEQQKAREASADAGLTPSGAAPGVFIKDRAQALGTVARVPIQTPTLKGSLSLQGARIDDLYLTNYKETLDKNSPPVELFRPQGMEHAYFAQFGWSGPNVAGEQLRHGHPRPVRPARSRGARVS